MKVRIAGIVKESVVDGPGIRYAIFAQGCVHKCMNCHNPETHDPTRGELLDADEIVKDILNSPHINGITLSGGDPFLQPGAFDYICEKLKLNNINVISFTGYKYEEILQDKKKLKLLEKVDVLIDGPFMIDKKSLKLPFRGSTNQRIIDIKASLNTGRVVEISL